MQDAHTDILFEKVTRHSDDPCVQVGCVIFNMDTKEVLCWGTNRLIEKARRLPGITEILATPRHPAKKFLIEHAEVGATNALLKHRDYYDILNIGVFCSLQPCMDCVKALAKADVKYVFWKEDNRHQDEQAILKDYTPYLFHQYEQKPDGLILKVSPDRLPLR